MFHETFQSGFLSIFFSLGSHPLQIWSQEAGANGKIAILKDEDIDSNVLEIASSNIATTLISCPATADDTALGIRLPFLILLVKNLKKYFTFEILVLDDQKMKRRFRASNFQSTTRVKSFICTMPLKLDAGWNRVQLNLAEFVKRAYGTTYVETLSVKIHANCRLRRVYFAEKLLQEDKLPPEFKLYSPSNHTSVV